MRSLLLLTALAACVPKAEFQPPEPIVPAWRATPPPSDPAALQAIFPLSDGDRWSWDIQRTQTSRGRFLFVIPTGSTEIDSIGTWTLGVGAADPQGRHAATLERTDDAGIGEVEAVSLWHEQGALMMEREGAQSPALIVLPPDDAVRGELVPCDVPMLGVQAVCNAIPGGSLGLAPGPVGGLIRSGRLGGDAAQDLSLMFLTGFMIMPLGGQTTVHLRIEDHPQVDTGGPALPLTEQVRSHRTGFLRVSKTRALTRWLAANGTPSPEDAIGGLRAAPTRQAYDALLAAVGEEYRLPLARTLVRRSSGEQRQLENLAGLLPELGGLDDADRFHLALTLDAPTARRQATRMLDGNQALAAVYRGQRTWSDLASNADDADTRRAVVDGVTASEERVALVRRMLAATSGQDREELLRYALWTRPSDRMDLLLSGDAWVAELSDTMQAEIRGLLDKPERRWATRAMKGR